MLDNLPDLIWFTHLAVTLFLVGLIWMVQVVHYPLFANVGADQFHGYWRQHTLRITWLVAPTMLIELGTAVALFFVCPAGLSLILLEISFGLIVLNWLSTWLVQIPCHERLGRQFDSATIRQLVLTNWIRTTAWSLRGILVLAQTHTWLRASLPVQQ